MENGSNNNSSREDTLLKDLILKDPDVGWGQLVHRFGPLIRNLIRNFPLTQEDQEEVFQEVSHNLVKNHFKTIQSWDPQRCSLAHYLAVVTIRVSITFVKSSFHRFEQRKFYDPELDNRDLMAGIEDPAHTAREQVVRLQLNAVFKSTIADLVARGSITTLDRQLLILRLSGFTYREIEGFLGISVETTTSRFSRLKPVLQRALQEAGIERATLSTV